MLEIADIAKIYTEKPKQFKENVNVLQEWLKTQLHLPPLTELQIILFLNSCCNEIEETKNVIQKYFSLKASSDLFRSGSEDLVRKTLSSFFIGFLPKKTPEGYVVMLFKTLDPRPEKYVCAEHLKVTIMIIVLYFHQYGPSNGLVVICDAKHSSFRHFLKLSISPMRQSLQFLQEAGPTRIKGLHYINLVPVIKHVLPLLKPLMKREVYDLIKLHSGGTFQTLHEYIPKECLPTEYGGKLGSVLQIHEENLQNIIKHFDFFKWHDSQNIDETKIIK